MRRKITESQFVTFALGNETFAVPVTVVREILDHDETFKIPHSPNYLLGLRDVRGRGVPIVDLRLRLGMSETTRTAHTRVLVIDVKCGASAKMLTLGLVADRVFEVANFSGDKIEDVPDIGASWPSAYIEAVVRRDTGFVVIVNLGKLFSEADATALTDPAAVVELI